MRAGMQRRRHGLGQIGGNVVPGERECEFAAGCIGWFPCRKFYQRRRIFGRDRGRSREKRTEEQGSGSRRGEFDWLRRRSFPGEGQIRWRCAQILGMVWAGEMKTHFSFGKNGIEVSVPEGFECQVIRSRSGVALRNQEAALGEALDAPIGCAPLAALAAGKKTAAISVCDITILNDAGRDTGGEHALITLSQETGGKFYYAEFGDIRDAFAKISEDLRTQYLIGYYPAQRRSQTDFRRIQVTLKSNPSYTLRYRPGYYARPQRRSTNSALFRGISHRVTITS